MLMMATDNTTESRVTISFSTVLQIKYRNFYLSAKVFTATLQKFIESFLSHLYKTDCTGADCLRVRRHQGARGPRDGEAGHRGDGPHPLHPLPLGLRHQNIP